MKKLILIDKASSLTNPNLQTASISVPARGDDKVYKWIAPDATGDGSPYYITFDIWGGGGGGGCAIMGAAGGGGGGYCKIKVLVIPNTVFYLKAGAGGAGGTTSGSAGSNGLLSFIYCKYFFIDSNGSTVNSLETRLFKNAYNSTQGGSGIPTQSGTIFTAYGGNGQTLFTSKDSLNNTITNYSCITILANSAGGKGGNAGGNTANIKDTIATAGESINGVSGGYAGGSCSYDGENWRKGGGGGGGGSNSYPVNAGAGKGGNGGASPSGNTGNAGGGGGGGGGYYNGADGASGVQTNSYDTTPKAGGKGGDGRIIFTFQYTTNQIIVQPELLTASTGYL